MSGLARRCPTTGAGGNDRALRDERGGVLPIVVVLIVPLMILAAFTVDFGMAYAQAQAFSAGADSAALAVVQSKQVALNASPSVPRNCQSLIASDAGQSLVIAKNQADANRPYDLRTSTGQVSVNVQLGCVNRAGATDDNGLLRATVTVERDVPTTLGRLAGVSSVKASRAASAALGPAQQVGKAFPLAICDDQAEAIMAAATTAPYPVTTIDVDKVWKADCSARNGSGNWGWLECGGNGIPTLVDAIRNGCGIDLTLSGTPPTLTVDGLPGNRINAGPVGNELDTVKGQVFPFPVYDRVTGRGANTEYRVVGFINLRFLDYERDGTFTVQYVSYSPVGEINTTCGIGVGTCSPFNSWVITLVG